MARKVLVAQCGGPTAVINASLAALIARWQTAGDEVWGARNGLRGIANGDLVELSQLDASTLERLSAQTGSALGGGRDRLDEGEVDAALDRLRTFSVDALCLIGGNGTMAAAYAIHRHAGDTLQVIGIPKTIDNDLAGTDVTPGFLSAAHFAIQSVRGAGLDLRSMSTFDDVAVIEVMGRHAGWLTAATALARANEREAPHILLLPEAPVDEDALLEHIADVHGAAGICLVAAAEGARNLKGEYLGELTGKGERDASGQQVFAYAGGVAAYLSGRVRSELGLRCRQMRPDTLYRTGGGLGTSLDRDLARLVGAGAAAAVGDGGSGVMIALRRPTAASAGWSTESVPFADIVGRERLLPAHYIAAGGMDVTKEFRMWARGMLEIPEAPVML